MDDRAKQTEIARLLSDLNYKYEEDQDKEFAGSVWNKEDLLSYVLLFFLISATIFAFRGMLFRLWSWIIQ